MGFLDFKWTLTTSVDSDRTCSYILTTELLLIVWLDHDNSVDSDRMSLLRFAEMHVDPDNGEGSDNAYRRTKHQLKLQ